MPIHLEEVGKTFGRVQALAPVSLTIADGTFVSLVGPSGCGKSTLLSLIAGLDTPTTGMITGAEQAGMVFQEAALFPWRTIRDNVAFGLQMKGMGRDERLARTDEALRLVHLFRFANAFPHELSGGMRQRAAIARALVLEPRVLLMDEPFGALDAQTRALLQAELLTVWERTRKTVVFVTHSLDEALALSDRILLMSARPGRFVGDFSIDVPRTGAQGEGMRDPQSDPALAALRSHLLALLTAEVNAVAREERDPDWDGLAHQPVAAKENIGADI